MTNFGARRLRLANPYAAGFREARSAVGAADLLKNAEVFKTVAEAVADCSLVVGTTAVHNRALQQSPRRLDQEAAELIRGRLPSEKVAVLFGSEKIGLTNDDFSHCHWLLHVPTQATNLSMNLGQAVAVCLYELSRTASAKAPKDKDKDQTQRATAGDAEQISTLLLQALHDSGYVKPGTDAMFEKKARWLILRFKLEAYDAKLLLGMIRQIVWKLRHPTKD